MFNHKTQRKIMADTRHKNAIWNCGETCSVEQAQLAVLMDIRDELKQLNLVFACQNFRSLPNEVQGLHKHMKGLRRDFAKSKIAHRKL
jgi:hypothetical protein